MKVGVLGGGQLGRMLALAGYPLGIEMRFLDPDAGACCGQIADLIVADYGDTAALDRFAEGLDVATFEFENVLPDALQHLSKRIPVFPESDALSIAQFRMNEKRLFGRLNIPVPPHAYAYSQANLGSKVLELGLPCVVKTQRGGYDGKGQHVLREKGEIAKVWQAIGSDFVHVEKFVQFDRELSLVAARGRDGTIAFYPLVENHHDGGILRTTFAPALGVTSAIEARARNHMRALLEHLKYVGVLAVEFFEVDGELLANEMAPRVHNSGHWTIEGAQTSQFENHLRAILGWPLGDTSPRGHAAMVNFIGQLPRIEDILRIPGAHFHDYGKPPRQGRKVGHVTLIADAPDLILGRMDQVTQLISA